MFSFIQPRLFRILLLGLFATFAASAVDAQSTESIPDVPSAPVPNDSTGVVLPRLDSLVSQSVSTSDTKSVDAQNTPADPPATTTLYPCPAPGTRMKRQRPIGSNAMKGIPAS